MARIDKTDTCWIWKGAKTPLGYGLLRINYKAIFAHRHAYQMFREPIPDGCVILHDCDNPSCVNPWHLRAGSQKENTHDARDKGRIRCGEQHHAAKLTTEQVVAIRKDARIHRLIAAEYGICKQHVRKIKSGLRRRIS